MKQGFSWWATISIIASVAVIASFAVFLRNIKNNPSIPSPSPAVSSTLESSPELSPTLSPSPETSPTVTPVPITHKEKARAAYQKGDYTTAISEYKLAIDEAKGDKKEQANLTNLLANSYRDNKNTTQAISSYNSAITLDPTLIAPYINLSNIYQSQNNTDKAKTTIQAGLKANPGNAELTEELNLLNLNPTGTE